MILEKINKAEIYPLEFINQLLDFYSNNFLFQNVNLIFIYSLLPKESIKISNKNIHVIDIPPLRDLKEEAKDMTRLYINKLNNDFGVFG